MSLIFPKGNIGVFPDFLILKFLQSYLYFNLLLFLAPQCIKAFVFLLSVMLM